MQPYQEAADVLQKQGEMPKRVLQKTGSIASRAAGSALGGIALGRVLPMLSQYIPEDLAIKGLSKIDPRFGKFIDKAKSAGKNFNEIKDFIKEQAGLSDESSQENPNQQRNVIEQYSPELYQFIKEKIQSGTHPLQAGALARVNNNFNKIIEKMTKDHKTNFSSIVETVFGTAEQPKQEEKKSSQSGGIDPQLLSIMQNMQNTMNKFRGG